jgi:hypothetical protein
VYIKCKCKGKFLRTFVQYLCKWMLVSGAGAQVGGDSNRLEG